MKLTQHLIIVLHYAIMLIVYRKLKLNFIFLMETLDNSVPMFFKAIHTDFQANIWTLMDFFILRPHFLLE